MPESIHDRIKYDRESALPDATLVREYREYAEGKQRGTINPEQKAILGSVWGHDFADNICDVIIAAAHNRLVLTGWRVESDVVQAFLNDLFVKNQVGDLAPTVHYGALRDGNTAAMLYWLPESTPPPPTGEIPETEVPRSRGDGRVLIFEESWWDGKDDGVFVAYDRFRLPEYAVRDFRERRGDPPVERRRRVVYFADHFERYILEGQGWQPIRLPSDPSGYPPGWVPWTKADGSPLGIPVVHFPNSRFGRLTYGASELAGGMLGQQDHLNDLQLDLIAAARLTAFQMISATGVTMTEKVKVGPGRVLTASDPAARYAPIPAGDLSQLINAIKQKLEAIARNSATPLHEITGGDFPSGIALLRAEIRFVSKIERLAKTIGPAWATVAHRATEIANAFGGLALDEDALITAVFAPPEKLDDLALAEVNRARVEVYARLESMSDPALMAKTGLVTLDEAMAISAARQERAASLPVLAEF